MNNHTPGPWQLAGNKVFGKNTAHQVCFATDALKDKAQTKADARLIAAAPDLLAALEALTAWAQTVPTDLAEDRLQANARKAIARATGESQ
jgi:hypothetical protein